MDDGDGGVPRESRRAVYEPPTGVIGSSDKEQCGGGKEEARVSAESIQGEKSKNGQCLVLKQGNVATLEATSLRYREELCQRRDVRGNVATF